jgi:excisionase family DNA binding protein
MAALIVTMQMHEFEKFMREIMQEEIKKLQNNTQISQQDEIMSIEEVQTLLHVSKVTIHKWKKRKLIQSHRIGRRIYFKKHEILNAMKLITIKNPRL